MRSCWRPAESRAVRRCRPLLGTFVEVTAGHAEARRAHAAVDAAFAAVERVHALMSFHDPASDVSRLNRAAHRRPVAVHPWTLRVLAAARRVSERTGGLFDCAIAPSLVRWRYLPSPRAALPRRPGGYRDIRLLDGHRVRFRRPLWIDLGGIAKGFAVDRAVEALRRRGISWGCVNAGGDLRIFGKRQTVFVRDPSRRGRLHRLGTVQDGAVATSALALSRTRHGGRWVSPVVHPGQRRACASPVSVTVSAPQCVLADALTKPLLLGAPPDIIQRAFRVRVLVLDPAERRARRQVHAA